MVNFNWHGIFSGLLELVLLAGALFYVTFVLLSYLQGKGYVRPRLDFHDPARSFERLAVWLGVKALVLTLRVVTAIFEMLSEASAEVGDWFLSHRRPETR